MPKGKYFQGDAWGRGGYYQPANVVLGANCTGDWSDSPCPTNEVKKELNDFRKVLKKNGISSTLTSQKSSNVFMVMVWVRVKESDFAKAKQIADDYLKKNESNTKYIYGAE